MSDTRERAPLGKPPEYYRGINRDLLDLLPRKPTARVLEFGCAAGRLGEVLKQEGYAAEVVGVESTAAHEEARRYLDVVHQVDMETWEFPESYRGYFGVLIFGDVLEHLRDPWKTLRRLAPLLRPGGLAVASLPNVRYLGVVLPLLFCGRWTYVSSGVLDETHLRFFTRRSMRELFTKAGYEVEVLRPRRELSGRGRAVGRLTRGLGAVEELVTRQYVVRARTRGEGPNGTRED
ncbi:MAG: class I SAM-dependent methyltransferase [candidate division WS1 bacterium]|nr:class I SAM-dependent methyltransferase [candidate division WS1 bacterium]